MIVLSTRKVLRTDADHNLGYESTWKNCHPVRKDTLLMWSQKVAIESGELSLCFYSLKQHNVIIRIAEIDNTPKGLATFINSMIGTQFFRVMQKSSIKD